MSASPAGVALPYFLRRIEAGRQETVRFLRDRYLAGRAGEGAFQDLLGVAAVRFRFFDPGGDGNVQKADAAALVFQGYLEGQHPVRPVVAVLDMVPARVRRDRYGIFAGAEHGRKLERDFQSFAGLEGGRFFFQEHGVGAQHFVAEAVP